MHLLGEGFILDIFRMGELIAPSPVEKRMFRMAMQDEARHVAYGTMHIRYAVEHDPDVAEEIHEALDHGEAVLTEFGTNQDFGSALAVLLGGGVEHVEDKGFPLPDRDAEEAVHVVPGPLRAGRHQPPAPHQAPARPAGHRPRTPSLAELREAPTMQIDSDRLLRGLADEMNAHPERFRVLGDCRHGRRRW